MNSPRDYLADAARACPTATGAASGGRSWTFGELDETAERFRASLSGADRPRVGVCLPNSSVWSAVLSGIWRNGGQAVLFPATTPAGALVRELERAQADVLVTSIDVSARLDSSWDGRLIDIAEGAPVIRREGVVDARASASAPGAVLFTSGTTNAPKPVELSYKTIASTVEATLVQMSPTDARPAAAGGAAQRSASLIVFPLYHISGLFQLVMATARQAPAVILDRFDTGDFLDALAEWKVRQVVLNPTMLKALVRCTDDRAEELVGRLRLIRSGTAALDSATREAFAARFGVRVLQGYGSTETCGEIAGWTPADIRAFGETKAASVGRVRPGIGIAVQDDEGRKVGAGVVGRLAVRVPWVSDEWREIGDLGSLDEDGFLYIAGRADDVINCGGFMIAPAIVEEAIASCPGVEECAVVAEPDERLGEVPVAFVVPSAGMSLEVLKADIAASDLLPYQRPRRVRLVAQLPRNVLGKVVRGDLAMRSSGEGGM